MKLSKLLDATQEMTVIGNTDIEITGISTDSRKIKPGNLFIAVSGTVEDGHRYMDDALKHGAVALAGETDCPGMAATAFIKVPNSRIAAAFLAEAFYGHPSRQLDLVGITGTTGRLARWPVTKNGGGRLSKQTHI